MKHISLVICFLAVSVSGVRADLRYTLHTEVRSTSIELKAVLPHTETVMLLKGDAIRIEQSRGAIRSVLLIRPDGQFVLNPEARTYRRIPDVQSALTASATTAATFRRTGAFMTILGLRAERVEVTMSLPLPITPPPGVPTVLPMAGELWVTDAHRSYARSITRALGQSGAVTSELEGIVLHLAVRNVQLGIEMEHVVTELVEAPLAAEMFEVPDGFRAIIDPAGRR